MIGRRALLGFVLAAGLLAAAWVFGDHAPGLPPGGRMGGMMLSRVVTSDVVLFKDDTVMHGPLFYRFEADAAGVRKLAELLDLQPVPRVPGFLAGRIDVARARTGWAFDWAHGQVYAAFRCDAAYETPFDVLLVDGRQVVYLTSGFADGQARASSIVTDPGDCHASSDAAASAAGADRRGTAGGHPD